MYVSVGADVSDPFHCLYEPIKREKEVTVPMGGKVTCKPPLSGRVLLRYSSCESEL
jgi:hypothetical protein